MSTQALSQSSSFAQSVSAPFDVERVRADFPALQQQVNGQPLIYLDTAASCHKPALLLPHLERLYLHEYAKPYENHPMSKAITAQKEEARQKVADLINASKDEVVFVRGCTEGINLVATCFERAMLQPGDEVLVTQMAHHSNYLPWEMACRQNKAILQVLPITPSGEIDLDQFEQALTNKTRIVAIEHSSHVLGTINPIKQMVELAHRRNIPVLVDGAQAAPHMPVDMQELGCDFYTFSGHKMGSPSGVGVLYGRKEWLDKLPPYQLGEDMVETVSIARTLSSPDSKFASAPMRFEGGTHAFAEIIAFGHVVDYLQQIGRQQIQEYEESLLHYATEKMQPLDRVTIIGTAPEKEPLVSFTIDGIKAQDAESWFNKHTGIALRAGELSAQPLMKALSLEGVVRISFGFFNTTQEIDTFVDALHTCIREQA
ncbi:aminotransferase class V-fold PLP-dependent enzyme [Hymenobacter sediminis]|uniref:aminotransferase class V-fold PLP-dependent enzyme n=1 Tax=Hymenobacter sediminis TaxID=2218621 RepID=UPI000DA6CED6|nr:aminotransferase class V-fold PLP-dependent enzyme [Hymenobacter sediminis]RPD47880.1 aminotransferase class V-fold PLP-dependent enzyme [Hymenobacter sediminis]